MPRNFIPSSGGFDEFYNGNMTPPVKGPNNTLVPVPNWLPPAAIYQGMYPTPSTPPGVSRVTPEGLNVYSRPTVAIGPDGNPVTAPRGFGPSGVGNSWSSVASAPPVNSPRGGMLPFPPDTPPPRNYTGLGGGPWRDIASASPVQTRGPTWQEQFTSVTGQPLVAATPPKQNFFDFLKGGFSNKTPQQTVANNGPSTVPKDETRLGYAGSPLPEDPLANPALTAIDQLTGSGRSTAMPFPLMGFNQPRYSEPIDITIQGGNKAPNVAMPRARPSPPQIPGAITFKSGDTVSALAKARGMTTASFADLFGISNPNKIKAGQTVFRQPPVMPRMPPAGLNRGPAPPVPRTPTAAMNRSRQIAEGKASQLDEFGMIR
jgi:LysM repeat protein